MKREKSCIYALLLAVLLAVVTYSKTLLKESLESPFDDFGHYWLVASLMQEGYDVWQWDDAAELRSREIAAEQGINPTIKPYHSSGFFLFIAPFTRFSFKQAVLIWLVLGHLFFIGALWILFKRVEGYDTWEDILFMLFAVFSFWPLREQLHQMQPNFLILLGVTFFLSCLKAEKYFWAGVILGVVFQMREYLAVMTLLFVWRRQWSVLAGFLTGFVLWKACAVVWFGWKMELSYWRFMLWFFGEHAHFSIINDSVPAFIHRAAQKIVGIAGSTKIASVAVVLVLGSALLAAARRRAQTLPAAHLWLIVPFLVTPWVHESHFIVLYPAMLFLWKQLVQREKRGLFVLFIGAYVFMGTGYSLVRFPGFHSGLPALLTGGKILGVMLLYIVTALVIRDDHQHEVQTDASGPHRE